MKKLKLVCLCSFVFFGAFAIIICTNAKQLSFVLKTLYGDPAILENIEVKSSLFFESEAFMKLFVKDGLVSYAYSKQGYPDNGYISEDEFRTQINYTREDPEMENRKISENSISYEPYSNEKCVLYEYPQTYADVEVTAYGLMGDPIETKLKMYAEEDYPIYFTVAEEGTDCYFEEGKKKSMRFYFGINESSIGEGSDGNYYMMPTISSNMEGVAEVYRLRPTKQSDTHAYNTYSQESIYSFNVERGTISTLKYYNDHIYLWTLRDNVATFQTFDLNMNLLQEDKRAYPLSMSPITSPLVYTNDQYMIVEVDRNLHVYDVETGKLVYSDTKLLKEQLLFYHEDVLYNGEYIYVCGVEDNREHYKDNLTVLAFNQNDILYKGRLEFYENAYEHAQIEEEDPYYYVSGMPYMVRGAISFVRKP